MEKSIKFSGDKKQKNNFIVFLISFVSMVLAFVSGQIFVPSDIRNIALPSILSDVYTVSVISFVLSLFAALNNKGLKVDKPFFKFCINYFVITLCIGIGVYGAQFFFNLNH